MPTQAEIDATRKVDGLPELNKLAKQLCRILTVFAPIIRNKYPTNEPLMTALESAVLMCGLLPEATRNAIVLGGDNAGLDGESAIVGEDVTAPTTVYEIPE